MIGKIIVLSADQTREFGYGIGTFCEPGDVICLGGGLGAGKTTITQAIARGTGVDPEEYVCSPSFSVLHEYCGNIPFYHMDFYRLDSTEDISDMGLDEYFYLSGVTVIEWYEKASTLIPPFHLLLQINVISQNKREIIISSESEKWQKAIAVLLQDYSTNQ